jgi:leader peptidase (prepilin peptidase)/N-methyltransferase
MILFYALLAFVGGSVGSFVNVFVMRSINGENWITGRSRCDSCKHKLAWYDNIPLISYLILGGRCRYCGAKIAYQHIFTEALFSVLFVWWGTIGMQFFKLTHIPIFRVVQPVFWLFLGIVFAGIFFVDLIYSLIPDVFIWSGFFLIISYRFLLLSTNIMQLKDFINSLIVAFFSWLFFYILYVGTHKKGLGLGDVYLAPMIGLLLGWPRGLFALMLSFIIGAIVGVFLMLFEGKNMKTQIPFGPFIIFASFIMLVWGDFIIKLIVP